ncbi:subclass B3 metallo-beta-lactamase [Massilia eurypsychrophila]|uniref:Subclass B3 metallo-beta-lactamase n=1 Tax=Massilia eurypsychrophila TaxID=1485217 RepID=A0A2G8TDL6_9BURK|nr:subclass B3 metallo-beta-lactamase [Massilia eurypsychrophila]PIL44113.1 subclass B3 metallo-beta-lactamase [Massilia eurypsychrophila]
MTISTKLVLALLIATAGAAQAKDGAINCDNCAAWNKPVKPFNVVANTWYVGVDGLSVVLITGPEGHILVDGALPQSAKMIEASIKELGFSIKDVKLIVNSHAHWDHAGAIAALQRASGAVVAASASSALGLQSGANVVDDPQYQRASTTRAPKVRKVRVVGGGEVLKVGPLAITAHLTPGHTPGATSWSWNSCDAQRCVDVVYADSLNPVSSDDFYFIGKGGKTPDISASFAGSIAKVAALKCDVVLSAPPSFSDTFAKAAGRTAERNPFVAPGGCKAYAADAAKRLDERLKRERSAAGV